jgi:hypothetical protein
MVLIGGDGRIKLVFVQSDLTFSEKVLETYLNASISGKLAMDPSTLMT